MLRIGTASLALGLVSAVIFEALHPARENPNDDPQVFAEYAQSGDWITIHLGQLAGALLLIVGLGALSGGSLALGRPVSAAWARLATATAVVAAAAYGVLQVVDGVALKRAVDAWAAAPAEGRTAAFAAAQTVRWIEYGLNALTFSLVGLTLVLVGVAALTGDRFPRGWAPGPRQPGWRTWPKAWAWRTYQGFAGGITGLVALVLFGTWVLVAVWLMSRRASRLAKDPAAAPRGDAAGGVRTADAG